MNIINQLRCMSGRLLLLFFFCCLFYFILENYYLENSKVTIKKKIRHLFSLRLYFDFNSSFR